MPRVHIILDRDASASEPLWTKLADQAGLEPTVDYADRPLNEIDDHVILSGDGMTIIDSRKAWLWGYLGAFSVVTTVPLLIIGASDRAKSEIAEASGGSIKFLPQDALDVSEHVATILAFMRGEQARAVE